MYSLRMDFINEKKQYRIESYKGFRNNICKTFRTRKLKRIIFYCTVPEKELKKIKSHILSNKVFFSWSHTQLQIPSMFISDTTQSRPFYFSSFLFHFDLLTVILAIHRLYRLTCSFLGGFYLKLFEEKLTKNTLSFALSKKISGWKD